MALTPEQLEAFRAGVPGVYRGIPSGVYHALDAASASRLKLMRSSPTPEHAKYRMDNPRETDLMRFGSAFHMAVLEPQLYATIYAVAGQCEAATGKGSQCTRGGVVHCGGKWYCQQHKPAEAVSDRLVLSDADYRAIEAMARRCNQHPTIGKKMLAHRSDTEVSILWIDERTGELCKMRADGLLSHCGWIMDLKATKSAKPDDFERVINELGYHMQAAFYLDGAKAAGLDFRRFTVVPVEYEPPYGLACYAIDPDAIDAGRKEYRLHMATYSRCKATGEWPGYPPQVQTIGIPEWARRRLDMVMEAAQTTLPSPAPARTCSTACPPNT